MVTNASNHSQTKHIDLCYHKIRELVKEGTLAISYVPSEDQLADVLTKAFNRDKFETLITAISVVRAPSA
jgi:hypothetical protein